MEANAYQMKGDVVKVVEFGEKPGTEKRQPDEPTHGRLRHPHCRSSSSCTRRMRKSSSAAAESYAQDALKVIADLKNRPRSRTRILPAQASYIAGVHADLGMIHLDRAQLGLMGSDQDELVKAENEYKQAVS